MEQKEERMTTAERIAAATKRLNEQTKWLEEQTARVDALTELMRKEPRE